MLGAAAQFLGVSNDSTNIGHPGRILLVSKDTGSLISDYKLHISDDSKIWATFTNTTLPLNNSTSNSVWMKYNSIFYCFINDVARSWYTSRDCINWTYNGTVPIIVWQATDGYIVGITLASVKSTYSIDENTNTWTYRSTWPFTINSIPRRSAAGWGIAGYEFYYGHLYSTWTDSGYQWIINNSNINISFKGAAPGYNPLLLSGSKGEYGILDPHISANYSLDGTTVTKIPLSEPSYSYSELTIIGDNTYIILGGAYYSYNLTSWSPAVEMIQKGQAGLYGNGYFVKVCVSDGVSTKLQISSDGIHWAYSTLTLPYDASIITMLNDST